MDGLLCYCRAGFEPDLAAELGDRAADAGLHGHARTARGDGYVLFVGDPALATHLPWRSLVFARQSLRLLAELRGLDPRDRIAPIVSALEASRVDRAPAYGTLWVEHPDSDAGSSRARNLSPVGSGAVTRSRRNLRQSARSRSYATRYQRRPSVTSRCGSTQRSDGSDSLGV